MGWARRAYAFVLDAGMEKGTGPHGSCPGLGASSSRTFGGLPRNPSILRSRGPVIHSRSIESGLPSMKMGFLMAARAEQRLLARGLMKPE